MFNTFYKTTLFYRQEDVINHSKENGHKFLFSADNPVLNKDGRRTYSYGSYMNIGKFLSFYNSLESDKKHFYEIISPDIPVYEYYDLDFKLDESSGSKLDNISLLNWFKDVRKEFISTSNITTLPDDFVVTTASNNKKISLHILNRNVIFKDNSNLKVWYNKLKEFIHQFYQDDPLKSSIDFSVCSSYRSMRIIHSSKYDHPERPLKLLYDKDTNAESIYAIHTFITNAGNDINLENKLISFISEEPRRELSDNVFPTTIKTERVGELLNLLSSERAGDYNDWIKVGWALKRCGADINLFKEWSKNNATKKDSKRCEEVWKSFTENLFNPVSLGTICYFAKIDNPDGYQQFIDKYKSFKVSFPFTPSITINQKFISSNIYTDNLLSHEVIALKSCMNTGKTWSMPKLFNSYRVKVVVYFRVSLNVSIYNKWRDYGFELYSDIQDQIIKTEKYNNIIIQIDSLHRIQGKVDLLILDELESTHEHICSSEYIKKSKEHKALKTLIKHTPKIIACDANLKDETINSFFKDKKVVKIRNDYKPFTNLKCDFYSDKESLIQKLFDLINSGKNIVVPTNSKGLASKLYSIIHTKFPDKKVLNMSSETVYVDVEGWKDFNVIIYTPKITAGVSFDETHFHSVVAFFTNKSCNAESSSQMLFRVRNLIDNTMFIHTSKNTKEEYLPITDESINSHINNIIKEGKYPIDKTGLSVNNFNETVEQNSYYRMYKSFLKKDNISKQYFYSYLKSILKCHGIKCTYVDDKINEDIRKDIRVDIKLSNLEIKKEEAVNIYNSKVLSHNQYLNVLNKKFKDLSDLNSIKRYSIVSTFDFTEEVLSPELIVDCIPFIKSYRNYTKYANKSVDVGIQQTEEYHSFFYNKNIKEDMEVSDSEGEDYEKLSLKKTIYSALGYDRKYLKLKFCLNFIKHAGFKSLGSRDKVFLNWENLYKYVYSENKNISDIFLCKPFKFMSEEFDPSDGKKKKVLMEFVNSKLDEWFGVRMKLCHTESKEYKLQSLIRVILEDIKTEARC